MKKIIFLFLMSISISFSASAKKNDPPDAEIYFTGSDLDYVTPDIVMKFKGEKIKWKISEKAKIELCIKDDYVWPFKETSVSKHNLRCLKQVNDNKVEANLLDFKGVPIPEGAYIEVGYSVFSEGNAGNKEIDPIIRIY